METQTESSYRDTISIVDDKGGRKWVYPKKPKGRLYNARTIVSIILLAILFGVPFLRSDGHPVMLFDILNRKIILFGTFFTPSDYYLFGLIMISAFVLLFLVTAVFGRVFCGWICPQTIFLEMVFRKIEYFIEGDYTRQMELNKAPWDNAKIIKKFSKYLIFFILSFIIANTFLAYIIGTDKLFKIMTDPMSEHLSGFISIMVFTGLFYFVFAWFREQACILVCPYGRLQSVLLNKNSIVIAYDFIRGEPRGKLSKVSEKKTGDCIDCKKCVYVCPTGIDIRNGTQLECVNCTACIDACDSIMDSINKPRGLIRFDSIEGIETKTKLKFTARVAGYIAVLLVLITITTLMFTSRKDIDVSILRTQGMLYQKIEGNKVSNLYNIKISNKTFNDLPVSFKLNNISGEIKVIGENVNLKAAGIYEGSLMVIIPEESIKTVNTPITIDVYTGDKLIIKEETSFLGPVN
ncbi:MAG TPA: cytochrome c oxidase accessory protein CcoG [Ignavibacteria bacterium]|nr:cytochrome c oxidase accessory protein CcoG [Ignavibacteria bacterium]HMR40335.1 cytochrome c oxidase accessory protein CcoG [Ignavibacteria bacterium]